jgi:hypothetical protein
MLEKFMSLEKNFRIAVSVLIIYGIVGSVFGAVLAFSPITILGDNLVIRFILSSDPVRNGLLVAGLVLIVLRVDMLAGGFGLLSKTRWGKIIALVSLGQDIAAKVLLLIYYIIRIEPAVAELLETMPDSALRHFLLPPGLYAFAIIWLAIPIFVLVLIFKKNATDLPSAQPQPKIICPK